MYQLHMADAQQFWAVIIKEVKEGSKADGISSVVLEWLLCFDTT